MILLRRQLFPHSAPRNKLSPEKAVYKESIITMQKAKNESNLSIMMVEDDRIVSAMVEHLLVRQGFAVISIADGALASSMIDTIEPPALILLDVMLPFIDGFELISQIRKKAGWELVPVIMLTSKTQERNVVRALEAGANDYIVKPFLPQELIARVKRLAKTIATK